MTNAPLINPNSTRRAWLSIDELIVFPRRDRFANVYKHITHQRTARGDDEYLHTVDPHRITKAKLQSNLLSIDVALILLILKDKSVLSCCETNQTNDIEHVVVSLTMSNIIQPPSNSPKATANASGTGTDRR